MSIQDRRARAKTELRLKILNTAARLFAEQGFENVTIRRISEEIEYSPATIYLHFKDKAELLDAICSQTFLKLDDALDRILHLNLVPVEKLRRCLREYIQFGLDHPHHYLITFCTPPPPGLQQVARDPGASSFQKLKDGLEACQRTGKARRMNLDLQAQTVWMHIHGVTSLLITAQHFPWVSRETLIDTSLDSLMRALHP
jgi:AcrR family transcriptional regulator